MMQRAIIQNLGLDTKNLGNLDRKMIEMVLNNLNIFEKIMLRLTGSVFLASLELEGLRGKIPLYLFKCIKHGYQINYPSGYRSHLICLQCINEKLKKMGNPTDLPLIKNIESFRRRR
jgi:hypothetical protein